MKSNQPQKAFAASREEVLKQKTCSGKQMMQVASEVTVAMNEAYKNACKDITGANQVDDVDLIMVDHEAGMQSNLLTEIMFETAVGFLVQTIFGIKINYGSDDLPMHINETDFNFARELLISFMASESIRLAPIFEEFRNNARATRRNCATGFSQPRISDRKKSFDQIRKAGLDAWDEVDNVAEVIEEARE